MEMKQIRTKKSLADILKTYHMEQILSDTDLPFSLVRFDKGEEIIHQADPRHHVILLLYGAMEIMSIHVNGSLHKVSNIRPGSILGDMEFALGGIQQYTVTADEECLCLVIASDECRQKLEQDPLFLMAMLKSVAAKLHASSLAQSEPEDLREHMYWLLKHSWNGTLHGVGKASEQLHCSRRQLQRILKEECDAGRMQKLAKGTYRLK